MTTRALVVGINNYPGTNALPSCVQDATAFSTHLQSKFAFQEIKALTDQQASKHAVLDGLAWLFNGATPQDRLVFFYSGHGYRPQINGELREALVTQDSRFLDDTELADAMVSVPDGVLTIVLDTCFSGGLEKLFIAEDGRIAHVVKSKFWTAEAPTSQVISSKGFEPAAVSFRPFGLVLPLRRRGMFLAPVMQRSPRSRFRRPKACSSPQHKPMRPHLRPRQEPTECLPLHTPCWIRSISLAQHAHPST